MANTSSAKKATRVSARRATINKNRTTMVRTTVRKVEEAVRDLADAKLMNSAKKAIGGGVKQEIRSLQFRLQAYFGAKVVVKADEKGKGEIKIPFTSQEDLDKILLAIKA